MNETYLIMQRFLDIEDEYADQWLDSFNIIGSFKISSSTKLSPKH